MRIRILSVLVCVVILTTVSGLVCAGAGIKPSSTWTVEAGIRLGSGWPHSPDIVELPDGSYRMYHGDAWKLGPYYPIVIRSAVSSDALTWVRESGIRIGRGYGGHAGWADTPDTMVLPDGTYRMYYSIARYPFGSPQWGRILSAVSADGLSWTTEAGVRVDYGGTYDGLTLHDPNIVELPDGTLRMYYVGSSAGGTFRILSAVSTDGLTWTKESGVRIDIGGTYDSASVTSPQVIQVPDGRYMMFYAGVDTTAPYGIGRILSAVSTDGLTWTKESGISIDPAGLQDGPYYYLTPGQIMKLPDGRYRMYFGGDRYLGNVRDRMRILSAIGTIPPLNQPPVALCQAAEVLLDEDGQATVSASDIDGGSYDPDGDEITLSVDPSIIECEDLDEHREITVILTVSDGELEDSCQATVTVVVDTDYLSELVGALVDGSVTEPTGGWRNHGQYVSAVAHATNEAMAGLTCLTDDEYEEIHSRVVSERARSRLGKPSKSRGPKR